MTLMKIEPIPAILKAQNHVQCGRPKDKGN